VNIEAPPDTNIRASAIVRASLIEQNQGVGVIVAGSDATIEATVVRATLIDQQGNGGWGINIRDSDTNVRAAATVLGCLVEENHDLGIHVTGSDTTIEATVVRATLPNAQGQFGRGISIQANNPPTMTRANVTVRACLVEANHEAGVFVSAADATIEATVVRSTLPNGLGAAGRGINIEHDLNTQERSSASIRACLVEENHNIGIFVISSDVTIASTIVRDTAPEKSGDLFGDGIAVFEGTAMIQDAVVTNNARAGISNFAGQVVVTGGVITCNGFDLEGEPINNIPFTFDGSTGWQCSDKAPAECTELGACHVETIGIEAPADLPPAGPLPQ
jgi:hypothetical protein